MMDYKEACDILEEIADWISKSDLSFETKIKYSTALDFGIYGAEKRIPESPIHTDDTYSKDVNDDAYHRIVGSYKSIYNKNPILDYRIRHPKCKFCKYYKSRIIPAFPEVTSQECTLKDKNICYPNMPRICKYYYVKDVTPTLPDIR